MNICKNSKIISRGLRAGCIFAIFLPVLFFLGGCASHQEYRSQPGLRGDRESGQASYYAMKFQDRRTASGDRFDNYAMTAAHKTLPFGTRVIVTNRQNGRSVRVTINDRGPYVEGRIIDLTQAAFAKIENLDKGIAEVEIRVAN